LDTKTGCLRFFRQSLKGLSLSTRHVAGWPQYLFKRFIYDRPKVVAIRRKPVRVEASDRCLSLSRHGKSSSELVSVMI
jgi:hypothetical protein